jgi:hypothetical protein
MYGLGDLKPVIYVGRDMVECPVRGCVSNVTRQTGGFQTTREFRCPYHGIFISPRTFEYEDPRRNFPLLDEAEWELTGPQVGARERDLHRLARERSEDAITYNVFRGLEKAKAVAPLAAAITGRPQASAWVTYLSRSEGEAGIPSALLAAQKALEGRPTRSSRPDLIIDTPTDLIFVEAKVTSSNNKIQRRPKVLKRWATRKGWYDRVFKADIEKVAIERRKYGLMRLWMLGSWMAAQSGKHFTLVALTRASRDRKLEREFRRLVRPDASRDFVRWTWEQVAELAAETEGAEPVAQYLRAKSLGYDSTGRIRAMCG